MEGKVERICCNWLAWSEPGGSDGGRSIAEADKPKISPAYVRAIVWLFVFSLATAGLLFVLMSLPTITTDGGLYSSLAGVSCLLGALIIMVIYLKRKK